MHIFKGIIVKTYRPAKFKELDKTSRIGAVFAGFNELVRAFEQPHDRTKAGEWESKDNKVRAEWAFAVEIQRDQRTFVFSIYDFKEKTPLKKLREWSLAGRKEDKDEIIKFLADCHISAVID
jgi:hypothetical protein